jgi:hypothetical protein
MEDMVRYLNDIVEPTVGDFRNDPSSVRHAFLACVAIDHAVDYLAYPGDPAKWDSAEHRKSRAAVREQFRGLNEHFRLASDVANAFKHVKNRWGLEVFEVYQRPPAVAGVMEVGNSLAGDEAGAVIVDDQNLLHVIESALQFLRSR